MSFYGEREHRYGQQLADLLKRLEHEVVHDIEVAADNVFFHHEHPPDGYARVIIDCHIGPHKEHPYHVQEDFSISQLGSQPHAIDVYHQLGISIVTMEAAHALDLGCQAIPRIDIMYGKHGRTIAGD